MAASSIIPLFNPILVEQKIETWRHLFSDVISNSMSLLRLNQKGTLSRIRMLEPFHA